MTNAKDSPVGEAGKFWDERRCPLPEGTHTVFGLIPEESSAADGLGFQPYTVRLAGVLGVPEEDLVRLLPASRKPWTYYEGAPPDYSGYVGVFTTAEDVEKFVACVAVEERRSLTAVAVSKPVRRQSTRLLDRGVRSASGAMVISEFRDGVACRPASC